MRILYWAVAIRPHHAQRGAASNKSGRSVVTQNSAAPDPRKTDVSAYHTVKKWLPRAMPALHQIANDHQHDRQHDSDCRKHNTQHREDFFAVGLHHATNTQPDGQYIHQQ